MRRNAWEVEALLRRIQGEVGELAFELQELALEAPELKLLGDSGAVDPLAMMRRRELAELVTEAGELRDGVERAARLLLGLTRAGVLR